MLEDIGARSDLNHREQQSDNMDQNPSTVRIPKFIETENRMVARGWGWGRGESMFTGGQTSSFAGRKELWGWMDGCGGRTTRQIAECY